MGREGERREKVGEVSVTTDTDNVLLGIHANVQLQTHYMLWPSFFLTTSVM